MTQHQLDRAVAARTGDRLATIRQLGFQLLVPTPRYAETEDVRLSVDCPFCGRCCVLAHAGAALPALAECDRCDLIFDYEPTEVYVPGQIEAA